MEREKEQTLYSLAILLFTDYSAKNRKAQDYYFFARLAAFIINLNEIGHFRL